MTTSEPTRVSSWRLLARNPVTAVSALVLLAVAVVAVLANAVAPHGVNDVDVPDALQPPSGARCFAFDVAFYSEEYPEYVGSSYDDAFTAQLGDGYTEIVDGSVQAQANFAKDPTILRTIVKDADQNLGAYASVIKTGEVRIGDPVEIS